MKRKVDLPVSEDALKQWREIGRILAEPRLIIRECGPSKCDHDYSRYESMEGGGTAVCAKCGARAFDEAAWL